MLSSQDRTFIDKRRHFTRYWPMTAGLLLTSLAVISIWLWHYSPYLANPLYVIERLKSGTIDTGMLEMSVLLVPLMTLIIIVLLVLTILLGFASFANEKRYQSIIGKLLNDQ
ncbi:MAG: hypothetical protein Kow0065_12740 [Methylomicrobium sp.]